MKNEEAIKLLVDATYSDEWQGNEDLTAAHNMAIKALAQEPCEDAISRLAVINALCDGCELFKNGEQTCRSKCEEYHFLATLPPVNPQPKTGHWIRFKEFENGYYHIKCSECGQYWSVDGHAKIFRYCFNCGAKMKEVGE